MEKLENTEVSVITEQLMTEREHALYSLLSEHENGLTLKEICELLPIHFVYDTQAVNPCRTLYRSIEMINLSLEVDKSIVKNKNGRFKFATREETEKFIDDMLNKAMTYLKRRSVAIQKAKQNGQSDILSSKPIYHEAFAKLFDEESIEEFLTTPPFTPLTLEEQAIIGSVEEVESVVESTQTNANEDFKQNSVNTLEQVETRLNGLKSIKGYVLTARGDIVAKDMAKLTELANGTILIKYVGFRQVGNSYFAEDVKSEVVATSDSKEELGGEDE